MKEKLLIQRILDFISLCISTVKQSINNCRKLSEDKTQPEYKENLIQLIKHSVILLLIFTIVSFSCYHLARLIFAIYTFLKMPQHKPLMIIATFTVIMFGVALLLSKRQNPKAELTEEDKLNNHTTLKEILCDAIIPVCDILQLKPPSNLSELNPETGIKHYEQSGTVVYCYSCYLKKDVNKDEIDSELIKRTLNSRILQMKSSGRLPIIAHKGVLDAGTGNIECPIKIITVKVFRQNIVIEATMYEGL